jgi:hypothetical protein
MNSRRLVLTVLASLALCAGAAGHALAQTYEGSRTVRTTVNVIWPPLTGTGVRPLQFGQLVPGAGPVTVLPNASRGGEWRLTGVANRKSLDITFGLPTALTGPGGATMPISFNGNFAAACEINDATQECETASYFTWNPVTTPTMRDTPQRYRPGRPRFNHDHYSLYIGGTVTPAATQRAGIYTGSVQITIVAN